MCRDPLTMAIEASLRDLHKKEEVLEEIEAEEEEEVEELEEPEEPEEPEELVATSGEQIESGSEYKYDSIVKKKRKGKDKIEDKLVSDTQSLKEKKEKHRKEKGERKKNAAYETSMEGLSESDIKTKLIESAKIKSKVARQSLEEKVRKKLKKDNSEVQTKEKKRKSSCDVYEDPLLSKKRKSSVSKERLSDRNNFSKCDKTADGKGEVGAKKMLVTSDRSGKEVDGERSTSEVQVLEGARTKPGDTSFHTCLRKPNFFSMFLCYSCTLCCFYCGSS